MVENWTVPVINPTAVEPDKWRAVFFAVPDRAIHTVSLQWVPRLKATTPIFHTSGATPLGALTNAFPHRGVFWPIRSMRRSEPIINWRDTPLVGQANSALASQRLKEIANHLGSSLTWLDDEQRARLHLAAVFSNNFVNALHTIAHRLCTEFEVPFPLLLPLIREATGELGATSPAMRQTGPAARGDEATLLRHLAQLSRQEDRELYQRLSRHINPRVLAAPKPPEPPE